MQCESGPCAPDLLWGSTAEAGSAALVCSKSSWCHKPEPDPHSLLWCFVSFKITPQCYPCCVRVNHPKLLQIIIRSPVSKQRLGSAWWYLGSVQIFQSLDGWIVLILSLNSFPTPAKRNRSTQFSDRQVGDNTPLPSPVPPPTCQICRHLRAGAQHCGRKEVLVFLGCTAFSRHKWLELTSLLWALTRFMTGGLWFYTTLQRCLCHAKDLTKL